MRWYLNDASLQGQFDNMVVFERTLRDLLSARARLPALRSDLRSTRSIQDASAAASVTVRQFLQQCRDKDLRAATFSWLDRTGPFVDDDRVHEEDDFFEFNDLDVTSTGLGEAARRTKSGEDCAAFSFEGGEIDFALHPLMVDHGLPEDRYGVYAIHNIWRTEGLVEHALASAPPIRSWRELVEQARLRFAHLEIPDLHATPLLSREPFEASVRDRALALMRILDEYVAGRNSDGSEGSRARAVIDTHFKGERALFTGESTTNENRFALAMTFKDLNGSAIYAPWHGKISHRHFRMHFEWPLTPERKKLHILYLGPKITKG